MRRAPTTDTLSITDVRRLALAAQGFGRGRPSRVGASQLARTIRQIGLLQIDFVNVLVPSHYLVPFSRLGAYSLRRLDDVIYRRREFTEHWAHEASIVPAELWPLLAYRRESHRVRPYGFETFLERNPDYVARVVDLVRERGALVAADLPDPADTPRRLATSWFGTVPRAVLEALLGRGTLAVADRRPGFVRVYDLAERVLPAALISAAPPHAEGQRRLLRIAARAHAVATADDLADYFRMPLSVARPRVQELVEEGVLDVVQVEGWRAPAFRSREAPPVSRLDAAALLSPFDPVVWHRPRARRIFGFDHRFEIFIPAARRKWGCYVLPFLLGDRVVARVDLRADRPARTLRVLSSHLEDHARTGDVAGPLAAELALLARWLGLEAVHVTPRGPLARALRAELHPAPPRSRRPASRSADRS